MGRTPLCRLGHCLVTVLLAGGKKGRKGLVRVQMDLEELGRLPKIIRKRMGIYPSNIAEIIFRQSCRPDAPKSKRSWKDFSSFYLESP